MSVPLSVFAQDNAPYSRYGLGDISHSDNIINKGMGGISQGYSDIESVNFLNPASYSALQYTTFDLGVESDRLKIADKSGNNFKSGNVSLSYLQFGIPLKFNGGWGLNIGLMPVTRVNYNIAQIDSLSNISKVGYTYQGSGGLYRGFIGTGYRIKNLSLGINAGYMFGSIKNSTRADYPDSLYLLSTNSMQTTSYGSFFWQGGIQYQAKLNKKLFLELGISGSASQTLHATRDSLRTTYFYSGTDRIDQDTAYYETGASGHITYPQQLAFGFTLHDDVHWLVGADYTYSKWSQYRFLGAKDPNVNNSWMLKMGAQYTPYNPTSNSYWNVVTYRVGLYYGKDYVSFAGANMPEYAFTFGLTLPIRIHLNQITRMNLAFEGGKKGKEANPLTENFYRLSIGFSLSDKWFIQHKYQ